MSGFPSSSRSTALSGSASRRAEKCLLAEVDKAKGALLPPMGDLCDRFAVSRPVLVAAARRLRDRGILDYRQGQRMRIAGRGTPARVPEPTPPRQSSAGALHATITEQIAGGMLKAGESLPKICYYVKHLHVSNNTVLKAYQRLTSEGVIHKQGKRWVVGQERPVTAATGSPSRAYIALLLPRPSAWPSLHADRTQAFCRAFAAEAGERSIRLVPLTTADTLPPPGVAASGRAAVLDFLRSSETPYLGALVTGRTGEIPDLSGWLAALCRLRKPVVWFDTDNAPPALLPERKYFTRCHFSEESAVEACLEHLALRGHRVVGYADVWGGEYQANRLQLLRSAAHGPLSGSIEVRDFSPVSQRDRSLGYDMRDIMGAFSLEANPAAVRQVLDQVPDVAALVARYAVSARPVAGGSDDLGEFLGAEMPRGEGVSGGLLPLLWHSPTLCHFLNDPQVTALIAPSDRYARQIYAWLEAAAVPVPRRISLISFDNYLELFPTPVSSVDFGFGPLGYAAFHTIYGDIPVRRANDGTIPASAWVVDRGSVSDLAQRPASVPAPRA